MRTFNCKCHIKSITNSQNHFCELCLTIPNVLLGPFSRISWSNSQSLFFRIRNQLDSLSTQKKNHYSHLFLSRQFNNLYPNSPKRNTEKALCDQQKKPFGFLFCIVFVSSHLSFFLIGIDFPKEIKGQSTKKKCVFKPMSKQRNIAKCNSNRDWFCYKKQQSQKVLFQCIPQFCHWGLAPSLFDLL